MVWSNAAIPAAELALFNADKPMIVGRNWNRNALASVHVWSSVVGAMPTLSSSWIDESDATAKADFGGDDFIHLQTFPDSTDADWDYTMDLGALREFDTVCLIDVVFSPFPSITVEIADDAAFSTNLQIIATHAWAGTEGNRLGLLDLDHTASTAQRYTAQYMRIRFAAAAFIPKIGEVVIGRRRQLKHTPNVPWDDNALATMVDQFRSRNGVKINFIRSKGQALLNASINPHEDAFIGDITAFFETDTDFGSTPFLWWNEPATLPHDYPMFVFDDPALDFPTVGFSEREFTFTASEQGTNFVSLG